MVRLVLRFFCFLCALLSATITQAEPLKVNYADAYPPLSFGKMDAVSGVLPELIDQIIVETMGQKVRHEGKAWKRAQAEVWHGQADALVTSPNPERSKHSYISKTPVFQLAFRPFTRKYSDAEKAFMKTNDFTKLKDFRFCDVNGNGWAKHFYKKYQIEYHQTRSFDVCLGLLAIGRVDVVVHADMIIHEILARIGLQDQIREHDYVVAESPNFHLMVSKESRYGKEFLDRFDEALIAMKESGEYQKLLSKITHHFDPIMLGN